CTRSGIFGYDEGAAWFAYW
nr:immunoglobulin heavy chain junction region [Mus musculus]